jgi:transcriptional regulator with XRE-family HTH domain
MKEYNILIKVRNNYLLTRMRRAGHFTVASLSRDSGVSQGTIGKYLNMQTVPQRGTGTWSKNALKLAKYFGCLPDDMFPPVSLLGKNTAELEMSESELREGLLSVSQVPKLPFDAVNENEFLAAINEALSTLPPRTQLVLSARFGLNGQPERTLEDIANELELSRDRVRQIEQTALRRLKHPSKSGILDRWCEEAQARVPPYRRADPEVAS